LPDLEPLRAALNDEGRKRPCPRLLRRPRNHDKYPGPLAVRDPHLLAVEHPAAAVAVGPGRHRRRVRPAMRLTQTPRTDQLPGCQRGQILLPECVITGYSYMPGAKPRVGRNHQRRAATLP